MVEEHSTEDDALPDVGPCYRCGKNPAEGFASIWTRETGELWYCHGDDVDPTCYMKEGSVASPE